LPLFNFFTLTYCLNHVKQTNWFTYDNKKILKYTIQQPAVNKK